MFRENFPAVQDAWQAFWKKENKRPLLALAVPKEGREPAPPPAYMEGFDGSYEAVADKLARWVETHEFIGEAIPYYPLHFGADHFTALLGLDMELGESGDTSWVVHLDKPLDEVEIMFRPDGKWWANTVRFYETLRRKLGDSVMISAPTISGGLDALAAIRSSFQLLYDIIDTPEVVKDAARRIDLAFTEILKAAAELFEYEKYGSINRHGMYTTGVISVPQCDFSCMISPEMFEEFAAKSIEYEINHLDAVEYHLDGPGALVHLERLAQIPHLDIVQWVAGAGAAAEKDWTPLYRRIVSLGKGLILGGGAETIRLMCNTLKSKSLYFTSGSFKSRSAAEDFIAEIEQMYAKIN